MGNGLHFPFVQHQSRLKKGFAVSGGTGPGDLCCVRNLLTDFLHGADGGGQRASVVIAVEAVEKFSVLCHQRHFRSGGAGIDA